MDSEHDGSAHQKRVGNVEIGPFQLRGVLEQDPVAYGLMSSLRPQAKPIVQVAQDSPRDHAERPGHWEVVTDTSEDKPVDDPD